MAFIEKMAIRTVLNLMKCKSNKGIIKNRFGDYSIGYAGKFALQ